MDFVFQGFQSGLPFWLYLLLAAATTGLAWWSYRDENTVRPLVRYLLIALRTGAFFVLIVLLLNPFFESQRVEFEQPEVLVLFDNSSSMAIEKGEYQGRNTYREVISDLSFETLEQRLDFRFFSVESNVTESQPESLTFEGSRTDLYNAIEVIRNNEPNARAALLFSDGLFNQGSTPVFLTEELTTPVFTVALGDTNRFQDLILQDIVTNNTGYLNTSHSVEAEISTRGFPGEPFEVQLRSGDILLESRTVTPESAASSHTVPFSFELDDAGLRQFELVIPGNDEEWSVENNRQSFSINVLDGRQRILSLAFAIHPDVDLVRTLLNQDENAQLSTLTWLGNNRFVEGDYSIDPDTVDLLVLHGTLPATASGMLSEWYEQLVRTLPVLYMAAPGNTSWDFPGTPPPLTASSPVLFQPVSLLPELSSSQHPVMELPEVSYQRIPAVYAPIQGLHPGPGITTLFSSSYQGNPTGQPLISLRTLGNLRNAQITGYGWHLLGQSSNQSDRDFIRTLIYNLVSWTAARPDNSRLKVEPSQQNFTGSEPISFIAFLTNESGEVEEEGVISITVEGDDMEPRIYNMRHTGNGQYQLDVGTLPEGIYSFEATARKEERTIDTRNGDFSVSGTNIEFVNTVRDDALMRQIASASGGTFYTYQNVGSIWSDMERAGLLEPEEVNRINLFYPYQHAFWFFLVVLLLGTEWFLRKYVALP